MTQKIPREVLWKDRATMKELFESQLFCVLHEAFLYFDKEPMLFPMNELDILNEVGYQVTWLCYESRFGMEPDMDQFIREVFAHTGLKDHAMTVISLVYAVVSLVNFPPLNISKQTRHELAKLNKESWCRRYVDSYVKRVAHERFVFDERFLPCQEILVITEEKEESCMMCAEPSMEEQERQDHVRRFTMDEILKFAKENLSLDNSVCIQNMLYALLSEDGTREEREKVNSIPKYILNRDKLPPIINGNIEHLEVGKADVVAGIVEKGANVYHH